ncbi:hypothetical protein L1887_57641 [Cichorium endivia]|nr:hypothetical protein L1887_57641 [Cichorium endivia]
MHFKIKDEFVEEVINIESEATIWGTQEALTIDTRNQDMVFVEEVILIIIVIWFYCHQRGVPEGAVSLLDLFPAYAAPAHASYGKNVNPKQGGLRNLEARKSWKSEMKCISQDNGSLVWGY